MGLNDVQEMLDAALADASNYEREIADLKQQIERVRLLCRGAMTVVDPKDGLAIEFEAVEVWRILAEIGSPKDRR